MKKSHRVAHEKSEAWWVLLLSLYSFYCGCQDSFSKKEYKLPLFLAVHTCCTECNGYVLHCQLSINQFVQHSFLCMIMFRLQAFYTQLLYYQLVLPFRLPFLLQSQISLILFLFFKNYDTIIKNSRQNPRRKSTWRKNGFGTSELYPEE